LTDEKISSVHQVVPILEQVHKARRKLIIIAQSVENEALATLILNKLRGLQVCAVKAPGFGDKRKVYLQDIAVLTGGQLITEELGLKLEDVQIDQLGTAKQVTVSADDSIILHGGGRKEEIQERIENLRDAITKNDNDYDREKMQERLAKLSGGVAIIKIGGSSEVEVSEKRDRLEDALNATKAAVLEGIVPGGGMALFYAARELNPMIEKAKSQNRFDYMNGLIIIRDAIRIPAKTIAHNAGAEGAVVLGKLDESKDCNYGYDAALGIYTDMLKSGIIDPTKVVRTALQDAASVASLMLTTEACIADLPEPRDKSSPPPGMGGMGGMGGGDMF